MKLKITTTTILAFNIFAATHAFAKEYSASDKQLLNVIKAFSVWPLKKEVINTSPEYLAKVELGRKLYIDKNLSGNRRISCQTCHDPRLGTSDAKALSQTEDGKGVLRRHSPHLYNIGDPDNTFMFWDGRVEYNNVSKMFKTPEKALNGKEPDSPEIVSVLSGALAAQAIFPLVSHEEMSGKVGENEIANAKTNLEAWDLIVNRLKSEEASSQYIEMFNKSYPETPVEQINIGHVGEALASFMREEFRSQGSPFHRFLAGDPDAMTAQQKRGLEIFSSRGRCITCHQGNNLGGNVGFLSVGVPTFGATPFGADRGRAEIRQSALLNFSFKTPDLVNLSLTAPYMHNGAFKTIREVMNHYNNINKSLSNYVLTPERKKEFPVDVEVLKSKEVLNEIWNSMQFPFLRNGLNLNQFEMNDLEAFLTEALTDPKFKAQIR
jgi:cytochrome c peroxidase